MKKKLVKLLSLILVSVMLCSVVPIGTMEVDAASAYNATAAISYANSYWNDGVGLCAEFVSRCLSAGGVSIPNKSYYSSSKQSYMNNSGVLDGYTNPYTCSAALLLYLSEKYTIITNPSSADISLGDVVFMYGGSSGQWRDGHVGIVISMSGGIPVYAAHNKATNTGKFSSNYPCTYVAKMNGDSNLQESTKYPTPLKAYTIATGKTTVYSSINGSAKTNKIYDTDACIIDAIYENGWCKVTFPIDAGGTETGYVKTAVFMDYDYTLFKVIAGNKVTVYTRNDFSEEIRNLPVDTVVKVMGHTSKAVQILYPRTSGGYGVGWVPISEFTYTIAYNANGGSGTMTSANVKYGGTYQLSTNNFTKTGYTFVGWNAYRTSDKTWYADGIGWKTSSQISANNYEKKIYKNGISLTLGKAWIQGSETQDTITFYPVWSANTLSVYFNANGAIINSDTYKLSNNLVYNKGDGSKTAQIWTYNVAKQNGLINVGTLGLTKEGHSFAGWGTSASGGTIFSQSDSELVPTSINTNIKTGSCSKTLYAIWEPNTYAVKYNANGGTGAPSAQTKTYGTTLKLSSIVPTRNGYTFKGWATTSTATSAVYQAGANYTANKAITLYAVWEVVETESTHTHEWNSAYTVDIEPTCTEEGIKSIHCKTCGEATKITAIPVLEHKYDEVILREASCSSVGEKAQRCVVCGYETKYEKISMEQHNLVTTVIREATCSQEGLWQDVCTECQLHTNSKVIPMEEHEFGEWTLVKVADANADGIEERICNYCEERETKNIPYIPVHDEKTFMISIGKVQGIAGDMVQLPIILENNPGFSSLCIVVVYDKEFFTLIDVKNLASSMNMVWDGTNEWKGSSEYSENGILATLTFEIEEEMPNGDYEIQIYVLEAKNSNEENVNMLGVSGVITVSSVAKAGWRQDNIGWWYQNANGSYPHNEWKKIQEKWYYFNAAGYMVTGWRSIGGTWYYLNGSGAMVTGWQSIGGIWYYFNDGGAMLTGWQSIEGTWYYFNRSGAMMTGWKTIGGTWYYLNGSGAMATGWQSIGGTWYYFNGSGAMVTGWQSVEGTWYYFNGSGAMVTNRWVGNYYLKANGTMAKDEYVGIYYVGADGAWIP